MLDVFQGQGIGRRLVGVVAERLAEQGICALTVPVFTASAGAREFYEALGARPIRQTQLELSRFGVTIETTIYGWHDVAALRLLIGP